MLLRFLLWRSFVSLSWSGAGRSNRRQVHVGELHGARSSSCWIQKPNQLLDLLVWHGVDLVWKFPWDSNTRSSLLVLFEALTTFFVFARGFWFPRWFHLPHHFLQGPFFEVLRWHKLSQLSLWKSGALVFAACLCWDRLFLLGSYTSTLPRVSFGCYNIVPLSLGLLHKTFMSIL